MKMLALWRPEAVAEVLEKLWGGEETVIVISSDLSHYHPYPEARAIDHHTVQEILRFDSTPIDHEQACGATPINGFLPVARKHHLHPRLVGLCNSGDTVGSHDAVVGCIDRPRLVSDIVLSPDSGESLFLLWPLYCWAFRGLAGEFRTQAHSFAYRGLSDGPPSPQAADIGWPPLTPAERDHTNAAYSLAVR